MKYKRPSYINYATIGWFIAHEITHGKFLFLHLSLSPLIVNLFDLVLGFDDEGRQFDINGNLANWWHVDTAQKFASKAQCIIDQVRISWSCFTWIIKTFLKNL